MTPASPLDETGLTKETLVRIWSPQRRNHRDVDIYLPASYERGLRHPVVYMQDGQNLSDPATAFAGTWELERSLSRLSRRGIDPIVVGVHNAGEQRIAEYSPFPDAKHGGGAGDAYLSFLIDTLKPRIDRLFRSLRVPQHTAIVGSSMGGLISLYAWWRRPDVFGLAGVMSPSLWYGRQPLFGFLEGSRLPRGRLYLDVGTAEGAEALRDVRALRRLLDSRGVRVGDRLAYLEDRGARHEEAAWSRRIAAALQFLLRR